MTLLISVFLSVCDEASSSNLFLLAFVTCNVIFIFHVEELDYKVQFFLTCTDLPILFLDILKHNLLQAIQNRYYCNSKSIKKRTSCACK